MSDISDVIKQEKNRGKRAKAQNEADRLLRLFEKYLNRGTEEEFIECLRAMRPAVSPERFRLALQIFRENRRS
jgi:hypothetical protein